LRALWPESDASRPDPEGNGTDFNEFWAAILIRRLYRILGTPPLEWRLDLRGSRRSAPRLKVYKWFR
jgi:hypothetical protein